MSTENSYDAWHAAEDQVEEAVKEADQPVEDFAAELQAETAAFRQELQSPQGQQDQS